MKLDSTSFGRHETFPLRFMWIPKGIQALSANPKVFKDEAATIELGVGKNMVNSIRYWLQAARLIDHSDVVTDLGLFLFDQEKGVDPYLEDEGTLWLLHWLIASNIETATSVFWFFNCFHKRQFTNDELFAGLRDFVQESMTRKRPSENTLKADLSVITRMYVQNRIVGKVAIEDVLTSPFGELGLLTNQENRKLFSSGISENSVPPEILLFATNEVYRDLGDVQELDSLLHFRGESPAPGAVFRLPENSFVSKLESALGAYPKLFRLNRTGVLNQLFRLSNADGIEILKGYYETTGRKAA
jgi:hypothetical protein